MIYVLRYVLVVLFTIVWGVPATLMAFADRSGQAVMWIARQWIRWCLAGCGVRVVSEGLENVDPRQAYVFMSNHQSVMDIGAIVLTIPVKWRFVAKRELGRIPLFGWALANGGHIMIDRDDRTQAIRSLEAAAGRISAGTNVVVFPEGTRSPDGRLGRFKQGGFHLAIAAQVPILPVTVSGTRKLTPKRSLRIESGVAKIVYGVPIPTRGLAREDRHLLMEQVRKAIEAGYDRAYQEPDA